MVTRSPAGGCDPRTMLVRWKFIVSSISLHSSGNERRAAATSQIWRLLHLTILATLFFVLSGNMAPNVKAQELTPDQGIASNNQVALPDNIAVDLPDIDTPKEIAGFSGAWAGDGWNGIIPTSLVVEKIDKEGAASAIFSWGDIAKPMRQRGWLQVSAIVDRGRLSFSIPDYGRAEFSLTSDDRLLGRFTYTNGVRYYSLLARIAPATAENVIVASRRMLSWEVVTIPLPSNADGEQPVLLRGFLYRSPVAGRKPIAIFSGDSAFSDQLRVRPNLAPLRSRQMLSLGYSVLALQRKGMGGSGGIFAEPRDESIPQLKQLQSALDDLDAAVRFVKQQDYVDPSRILLIGLNRGGLLSVAYAGLHDGSVAGVINTAGNWRVYRSWWQRLFSWGDFTTDQLAAAGRNSKVPMLWLYAEKDPTGFEYARKSYQGFVQAGGNGTFVGVSDADREERALFDYVLKLR
jgi:Serine aminopeptidase, S33